MEACFKLESLKVFSERVPLSLFIAKRADVELKTQLPLLPDSHPPAPAAILPLQPQQRSQKEAPTD